MAVSYLRGLFKKGDPVPGGHSALLTLGLCFLGLAFYVGDLLSFPYSSYTNDVASHIEYLRYAATHLSLPAPYSCWECYQPPLYYIISAIAYDAGQYAGLAEPLNAVRCVSMGFYAVFLYFAVRLLRENMRAAFAYYTALALLVFWPSGIFKASSITNDIPLYAAQMASFYYLSCWYKQMKQRSLVYCLWWSAIAFCFKSSGIVVYGVIAGVVFLSWLQQRFAWRELCSAPVIRAVILSSLLASLSFGRMYYYRIAEHRSEPVLVSNIQTLDAALRVSNELKYFVTFDWHSYMASPFYNTRDNATGRQYLWNTMLKSALFGEYGWKAPRLALLLAQAELAMLCYLLSSWLFIAWRTRLRGWVCLPFWVFVFFQVGALAAYRAFYPFSCSYDYRYIYTVTPVAALLYGKAIEWQLQHAPAIARMGMGIGMFFVVLTMVFCVAQW